MIDASPRKAIETVDWAMPSALATSFCVGDEPAFLMGSGFRGSVKGFTVPADSRVLLKARRRLRKWYQVETRTACMERLKNITIKPSLSPWRFQPVRDGARDSIESGIVGHEREEVRWADYEQIAGPSDSTLDPFGLSLA